jgi:TonB family protein
MRRTYVLSLTAHVVGVALLVLLPGVLGPLRGAQEERVVMTISLGGAPGPRAGGMTPMGGRPVQEVVQPNAKPETRPPAARTPEMTLPSPDARRQKPPSPSRQAPKEATARRPTTGAEAQAGSAVAETGGRGMGFGLSTGGGGTGGYLEVGDFCCPEYLTTMLELIRRNWSSKQDVAGVTLMKFTMLRNGQIANVELERSSGYTALDLTAQRALLLTRQLPPLPAGFSEPSLTVHLNFQYQR